MGKAPSDWGSYDGAEQESREALEKFHARIVMYDALIENAQNAYQDYIKQEENITDLHRLLQEIDPSDVDAMSNGSWPAT